MGPLDPLPLSPQVFAIFSALIESHSGIHHAPADIPILRGKLSERATARGFSSLLDYYYFIRYDDAGPAELAALVETIVVHETYFFREVEGIDLLVDDQLAPAVSGGRRPRVWCAACATGEEPLTLAMRLADRDLLRSVEVVASDISRQALDRAKAGIFGRRSLRAFPAEERARWTRGVGPDQLEVEPRLRSVIRWEQRNLLDEAALVALGTFDSILCRNVLIYFAEETARRVIATLTRMLAPGGRLLVGASESLLRYGTALACEERRGVFYYQKAA